MSNSRGIYLRKLIEEFPDDPYRGRIITRDYLAPRFFPHAVREYSLALKAGSLDEIRRTASELQFTSGLHNTRVARVVALLMPILCRPRAALAAVKLSRPIRLLLFKVLG